MFVAPERISTGTSVLELHAKDQSQHSPVRPEMVIFPENTDEVAAILLYANDHRIPMQADRPLMKETPVIKYGRHLTKGAVYIY